MKRKSKKVQRLPESCSEKGRQSRSYGTAGNRKLQEVADGLLTPAGKRETLKFNPEVAAQRIKEASTRKQKVLLGHKIYESQYCAEVVKLIMHPASLSWNDIRSILIQKYNFVVSVATLIEFKRNYLESAIELGSNEWFTYDELDDIRMRAKILADAASEGKQRLIQENTNIIEYFEKLALEVEDRIVKLKKKQYINEQWGGKLSIAVEQEISRNVSLLADMKLKVAQITSGYDLRQLRLQIMRDIGIISTEVFIPLIPFDHRSVAIAEYKKKLSEFSKKL